MSEKNGRFDPNNPIMTVHDIALYLRLSEAKVYKLAKEGQLPALRVGKSWRFRKDLVDEWIRKETELAQDTRMKIPEEPQAAD